MNLLYRRILRLAADLANILRIVNLNLKYEGLSVDYKSKIGRNCDIRCVIGSKIKIENSNIGAGSLLIADSCGHITISQSFIGNNCVIVAQSFIIINQNCQIAEMVTIRDQNHKFGMIGKTIEEQGFDCIGIIIGSNVWIGAKATILKGVTIGNNTVIGAHSLVNKLCDENTFYGGIPAKEIRKMNIE